MKLFKFEFKTAQLDNPLGNIEKPVEFKYAKTLKEALTIPSGGQGLSTDELLQSVLIAGKLDEAEKADKNYVLLDDVQYAYVKTKINNFRWSFAHKELAEFINYVRDLPKAEVDVK